MLLALTRLAATLALLSVVLGGAPVARAGSHRRAAPDPVSIASSTTATTRADDAFADFLRMYWDGSSREFYAQSDHRPDRAGDTSADFWWSAELWETTLDDYQRLPRPLTRQLIDDVFDGFAAEHPRFDSVFNDDRGWWALGATRAYQLTGEERFLRKAKHLWNSIWASRDSALGGGIWWNSTVHDQKNVATNARAASVAAELYRVTGKPAYRDAAVALVHWLDHRLRSGDSIADRVNADGHVVDWQFTYNYGTYAGAAARVFRITGKQKFLTSADELATQGASTLAPGGVLRDEGQGDAGGFKGIFVRNLELLADSFGQAQFRSFLHINAVAAWQHRRADGLNGTDWTRTPAAAPIESLTSASAIDLYEAAAQTH